MNRPPRQSPSVEVSPLEPRRLLSAGVAPSLSVDGIVTVPAGKTIQLPVGGDDANGDAITYSTSGASASIHPSSNPWLVLDTNKGSMTFQLFADLAPNTVRKIRGLVASGFYDGLSFHRIVNVGGVSLAQGGDPNGDGSGGPDFTFDDEFNPDAIFANSGLLAMANAAANGQTGKDANGSQFFVTGSTARSLDFNHTIFGQIVRGGKTLGAILNVDTDASRRPTEPVTIQHASIVDDRTDAVVQVRGAKKAGESTLTITATDDTGRSTTRKIKVRTVSDLAFNTPPILDPIAPIYADPGDKLVIPIGATDLEGDDYDINGSFKGAGVASATINQLEKTVVVRLADDAVGPITFTLGVKGNNAVARGGITLESGWSPTDLRIYDTQRVTISLGDRPVEARIPDAIAARPGVALGDKLLATFRSETPRVTARDFAASIDWGDGDVSDGADVRAVDGDGTFAVFGSHTFDEAATLPLAVEVVAPNGATTRAESDVVVADAITFNKPRLTLVGTDAADDVAVWTSDDTLFARVNDVTRSFALKDVDALDVATFDGNDAFDASAGDTPGATIDGGDGDDVLRAGPGNDVIHGGAGNDGISTGGGKNLAYGDDGDDRLTGSGGRDVLYGGDGADRLYGRGGDDTLDGGGGVDRLYGDDGDDLLIGGSGNDRLYGAGGDDTLFGKAGNDTLDGGTGKNKRGDADENDLIIDL